MEQIRIINDILYDFIWGIPAMFCIVCVGLLLTIRTRAIQIRKFPDAMKNTLGKIFSKKKTSDCSVRIKRSCGKTDKRTLQRVIIITPETFLLKLTNP